MKKLLKIFVGAVIFLIALFYVLSQIPATIRVERTFNAPVDKVWQAWTDTESIKKWWSPKDYTAPIVQNDFQLNGRFLFSMRSPSGSMSWNTGTYTEIIPNAKIVSTMSFADETGKAIPASQAGIPGKWPDEITVTAEFKNVDGKTQVNVTEVGIPMIMYVFAEMGWHQQFDKLETLL